MNVRDIFETMDYGPAPESAAEALAWLAEPRPAFGQFVNGAFTARATASTAATRRPGEVLARVSQATDADVDAAVKAARRAQPGWAQLGGPGRARVLYALARLVQKQSRLFAVLEIARQRQADPREPRHRHAAGRAAFLLPRRHGAADGGRTARRPSRWASAARSSRGTFRC